MTALQRHADARARVVAAHQAAVLRAATPRVARDVSRAFLALLRSAVHGTEGKELKGNVGISYSQPDYNEFEDALTKILTKEYVNIGDVALKGVQDQLGITLDFELNERIIPKGLIARKVTNVTDETKMRINKIIRQGIEDGSHPSVIAKTMRDTMTDWAGLTKSRAYTIARTETAVAYNFGSCIGYQKSGLVRQVRVLDGAGCGWLSHNDPDTAQGKIVSLQDAFNHPTSHPNCVRAFAPVAAGLEAPGTEPPEPDPDLYANPKEFSGTGYGAYHGEGLPLEQWGHGIYDNIDKALVDQDMKDALSNYSGSGYRWMNDHLRGKTPITEPYGLGRIESLEKYLDLGSTPDAVVVHRGVGSGSKYHLPSRYSVSRPEYEVAVNALVGKEFTEKGFMSTALDSSDAFSGVRLELTVPKGYKALPVSHESTGQGSSFTMPEAELLLQRGARYVIESVSFSSYGIVTLKGRILT